MKQKSIYFAVSGDEKTVKIGSSVNPEARVKTLSSAHKNDLSLVLKFPGDHKVEYGVHAYFGPDYIGHEWFRYSASIQLFVAIATETGVPHAQIEAFERLFTAGKWRALNAVRYDGVAEKLRKRPIDPVQAGRRGRPPIYKDRITALKRGKSIYFAGASQNSLKAIASHLGRLLGRTYRTEGYPEGVWVRRES